MILLLATLIAQMNRELIFVQPRLLEDSKLDIPQCGVLVKSWVRLSKARPSLCIDN